MGVGIDKAGLFMNTRDFREYYIYPGGAHEMIVKRPENILLSKFKDDVMSLVAKTSKDKLEIETWKEINPISQSLEQSQSSIMIIYFIIYIALGLLLVNSSLMSVFEEFLSLESLNH